MYCLAINNDIYVITISNDTKSRIYRISIHENCEENYVELLYESNETFIRNDAGMVADSKRNCLYFVFGADAYGSIMNNVSKFDIETRSFSIIAELDRELFFLSSTFWKDRYIILFGGLTADTVSSDIFVFDVEKQTWKEIYRTNLPIPLIYPRYMSGITIIPNNYASQFDPEIPKDSETDTLFIYGGFLEVDIADSNISINRPTHEVLLYYLKESEWVNAQSFCEKRLPTSLTDVCTPKDRKIERLHLRRAKTGLEEDDGDDSMEYKILPSCSFSTILPLKIRGKSELLIFRNSSDVLKVRLFHNNPFNRESMNKNPDIEFYIQEL